MEAQKVGKIKTTIDQLPQSEPDKFQKSVLVVDDDPTIIKVLKDPLTKAGYKVLVANHGLEALQVVKSHTPDLIILDILMPLLDGFRTARILKFDKRFQNIPIVVLTSRATEGERKIGEQVGADEFLYKPFRPPQVLNIVQRYLNA
ncbi:response regulator [bacterium]|nr:response regulator [bacterium]